MYFGNMDEGLDFIFLSEAKKMGVTKSQMRLVKPTLMVECSVEPRADFFAKNGAAFYATFIHRPYKSDF